MNNKKFSHILFNLDNHVKKYYHHNYYLFYEDLDLSRIKLYKSHPIDKRKFIDYMKTVRYNFAISYLLRLSKNHKYTYQSIADYFVVSKQTVSEWVRKVDKDLRRPRVWRDIAIRDEK